MCEGVVFCETVVWNPEPTLRAAGGGLIITGVAWVCEEREEAENPQNCVAWHHRVRLVDSRIRIGRLSLPEAVGRSDSWAAYAEQE
jgi:hypothetical protein